jgi:hypothetical protein
MKKASLIIVLLLIIIAVLSCKKEKTNSYKIEDKFYEFQKDGWKSRRINHFLNDINYSATEVPLQYYLLKQTSNTETVDSLYNLMNDERIVEFEFQHSNDEDLLLDEFTNKSYEESVKYMAFNVQKDFSVITTTNDTIACSGVHFERNFKVAPFKRVLLYFNGIPKDEPIQLIYNDHLFGNGTFKYNFNNIPVKL